MGFKKIKAKVKHARGAGPDLILKTLKDNYEVWEEGIKEMTDAERTEMNGKFDAALGGSGEALLGD